MRNRRRKRLVSCGIGSTATFLGATSTASVARLVRSSFDACTAAAGRRDGHSTKSTRKRPNRRGRAPLRRAFSRSAARRPVDTLRAARRQYSVVAVPRISKEDLKQRLDGGDSPVIVDARLKYPYEHSTLKLPGAIRYAGDIAALSLPRDREIVVYRFGSQRNRQHTCRRQPDSTRLSRGRAEGGHQ